MNTQCTTIIFLRLPPPTTLIPRGQTILPTALTLLFRKISSLLFHQQARKSSAPENIRRLFRLQNCLSRKSPISRKYSKTFRAAATSNHPASSIPAATSNHPASSIPAASSNHPANRIPAATSNIQQPAAAINSSNQQQQPATAINSSNQQQQSTAAISNHNQQQQPAFVLPAAPTRSTPAYVSYHYDS